MKHVRVRLIAKNKEGILLFRVREELDIPLTAVVACHGETGCSVFPSVIVQHFGEASIHLVGLSSTML